MCEKELDVFMFWIETTAGAHSASVYGNVLLHSKTVSYKTAQPIGRFVRTSSGFIMTCQVYAAYIGLIYT